MTRPANQKWAVLRAQPLAHALWLALGATTAIGAPTHSQPEPTEVAHRTEDSDRGLLQHLAVLSGKRALMKRGEQAIVAVRPSTTLSVTDCGDVSGTPGTLRSVIAGAVSGDTVDLSALGCSTITLTGGEIPVNVASLTLQGPAQDALTIDAGGVDRHFYHNGTGELVIKDLTVTNGRRSDPTYQGFRDGGCVLSLGKVVLDHAAVTHCEVAAQNALGGALFSYGLDMKSSTVSDSVAFGNTTAQGGGVFVLGSGSSDYEATLSTSSIVRNTVSGHYATGGAMQLQWSRLQASQSTISHNDSVFSDPACFQAAGASGGGVGAMTWKSGYFEMTGPLIVMSNSLVDGNTAKADCGFAIGGGVYLRGGGDIVLESSTVSGNVVAGETFAQGAGISSSESRNHYPVHHVSNSTISENVISDEFAGYYDSAIGAGAMTQGILWLEQSTVSGNRVQAGQVLSSTGGVYSRGGLLVEGSTIAFNSARQNAGGLLIPRTFFYEITSTIRNSIIAGNIASAGSDIGIAGNPQVGAISVMGANNLMNVAPDDPDVVMPSDTLIGDARLLPLALNGGPTETHALGPGSPALEAGTPSDSPWDQRGFPFERSVGAATDIGALERQDSRIALALAFSPGSINAGESSRLTITLVDTYPLAANLVSPLDNVLPAGLVIASPANVSTTCANASISADAGTSTISIAEGARIPIGSCSMSVDVRAPSGGNYVDRLAEGALSTSLGTNPDPAAATLAVEVGEMIFESGFEG